MYNKQEQQQHKSLHCHYGAHYGFYLPQPQYYKHKELHYLTNFVHKEDMIEQLTFHEQFSDLTIYQSKELRIYQKKQNSRQITVPLSSPKWGYYIFLHFGEKMDIDQGQWYMYLFNQAKIIYKWSPKLEKYYRSSFYLFSLDVFYQKSKIKSSSQYIIWAENKQKERISSFNPQIQKNQTQNEHKQQLFSQQKNSLVKTITQKTDVMVLPKYKLKKIKYKQRI